MDTKDFKDRGTLRSYFLKNKIPTEANFAELINSSLNQVEDGIFKPTGDPLSLVAAGDGSGPQKLINFYGNAIDAKPAWTLQMRPRADQNNPATAKAGFSVSDGDGRSRLFVDAISGNVGAGTVAPDRAFTVGNTAGANYLNVKDGTHEILLGVDATGGILSTMSNHDLVLRAGGNSEKIRIKASGLVGIGTANPGAPLDVGNLIRIGLNENGSGSKCISFARDANDEGNAGKIAYKGGFGTGSLNIVGAGAGQRQIRLYDHVEVMGSISGKETQSGWNLGGGAWGPDRWVRITTAPKGNTYHDLAVNSFWAAGALRYDLAEVTPVNQDDQLEHGDVVVIDPELGLRVTRCRKAGDTAVYGVVSSYEQAAFVIGGVGGPEDAQKDASNLPVALVGRVAVKVSAENGPIRVGDMLTTAETPGHAMRCDDRVRYAGAIVGKALEPLAGGVGVIKMLVTMQ